MIRWFKRKLRNFIHSDEVNKASCYPVEVGINSEDAMRFTVYQAIGGKLIEFTRYDRHRDRSESLKYIITNDDDLGEKIAKIVTLESMKN